MKLPSISCGAGWPRRHRVLFFASCLGLAPLTATPAVAADNWVGTIRCEIKVQADGYSHQETQTWTLTGAAPKKEGAFLVYPSTWSVTGQGSHDRTRSTNRRVAKWTANVPGPNAPVSAPVAFLVNPSGQLFVQLWHAQLTAPGGYTGTDQYFNDGVPQPVGRLVQAVYEWQFQRIPANPADTQITGSQTMEVKAGLGPLQPGDAQATITCTWALGQGSAPPLPPPTMTPPSPPNSGQTGGNSSAPTPSTGGSTASLNPDAREPNDTPEQAGLMVDRWWGNTGLPPKTDELNLTFHAASDTSDWIKALVDDKSDVTTSALQFSAAVSGGPSDGNYQVEIYEQTSAGLVRRSGAAPSHAPSAVFRWTNNPSGDDSKTLLIEVRHTGGAPSNVPYRLALVWGAEESSVPPPANSGGTPSSGGGTSATAKLLSVAPTTVEQGAIGTLFTFTGQSTHWLQPKPTIAVEPGIGVPVTNVQAETATSLLAQFDVQFSAAPGPRTVTVTTGTEVVSLPNAFTVTPREKPVLLSVSPNRAKQGAQNLAVQLTGRATRWTQGNTRVSIGKSFDASQPGAQIPPQHVTVVSTTVHSPTSATALVNIAANAELGSYWFSVFDAAPSDWLKIVDGFTVEAAGTPPNNTPPPSGTSPDAPKLLNVTPNSAEQGVNGYAVTLTGQSTHWQAGATQVNFGPGITVQTGPFVQSATTLTAGIYVSYAAAAGPRAVTVTTGQEVVTLPGALTISAREEPAIVQISPNSAQAGEQNVSVTFTGKGTRWEQGKTSVIFGGASVSVVGYPTVTSPTSMTAILKIDPSAAPGAYDLTVLNAGVVVGTDILRLAGGFTVRPASSPLGTAVAVPLIPIVQAPGVGPVITEVSPNEAAQGAGAENGFWVNFSGQRTHFGYGTTTVNLGAGISQRSFQVIDATTARGSFKIEANAPLGPRTVTLTTGAEVATLRDGFTVTSPPDSFGKSWARCSAVFLLSSEWEYAHTKPLNGLLHTKTTQDWFELDGMDISPRDGMTVTLALVNVHAPSEFELNLYEGAGVSQGPPTYLTSTTAGAAKTIVLRYDKSTYSWSYSRAGDATPTVLPRGPRLFYVFKVSVSARTWAADQSGFTLIVGVQ